MASSWRLKKSKECVPKVCLESDFSWCDAWADSGNSLARKPGDQWRFEICASSTRSKNDDDSMAVVHEEPNQCSDQLFDCLGWFAFLAQSDRNKRPDKECYDLRMCAALRAQVSDHSRGEGTAGPLRALAMCQLLKGKTEGSATTEPSYLGVGLGAAKRLISSYHSVGKHQRQLCLR